MKSFDRKENMGEVIEDSDSEMTDDGDAVQSDLSLTKESQPRGDESLIEWIDRQLKEAEERKKLKETNEKRL